MASKDAFSAVDAADLREFVRGMGECEPLLECVKSLVAVAAQMTEFKEQNELLRSKETRILAANAQLTAENETLKLQLCQRLTPEQVVSTLKQYCLCGGDLKLVSKALHAALNGDSCEGSVRPILLVHAVVMEDSADEARVPEAGGQVGDTRRDASEAESDHEGSTTELTSPSNLSSPSTPTTRPTAAEATPVEVSRALVVRSLSGAAIDRPTKRQRAGDQNDETTSHEYDSEHTGTSNGREGDLSETLCLASTPVTSPVSKNKSDYDGLDRVAVEPTKSISRVVTYWWKAPTIVCSAPKHSPRLSLKAFKQLEAAKPWNMTLTRRSKVSWIYNYQALGSRAKEWVRSMQWFQFAFRRELWEWNHWVDMDERPTNAEWEAYRRDRDDRISNLLAVWTKLYEQAAMFTKSGELSRYIWLDPSLWIVRRERLGWQHSTSNLVQEQAKEDCWNPVRCNYLRSLDDHPFHSSNYKSMFPEQHDLPPLTSPDETNEVRVLPIDKYFLHDACAKGAIKCPTSWETIEFAPRLVTVPYSASSLPFDVSTS